MRLVSREMMPLGVTLVTGKRQARRGEPDVLAKATKRGAAASSATT